MSVHEQELKRLLVLYRKGHISEELLLEQMAEVRDGVRASAPAMSADPSPNLAPNGTASVSVAADADSVRKQQLMVIIDCSRAAEASGACTLEGWARLTADAGLEGGLRTAAAREATHALLLEQRLVELGGSPDREIPDWLARFNAALLAPEASDLDRLSAIVAQFPDLDEAEEQLDKMADAAGDDELTRELFVTIREDELATLRWVHKAFQRLKNRV